MTSYIFLLLATLISTVSFVKFEPAPFDILAIFFILSCILIWLRKRNIYSLNLTGTCFLYVIFLSVINMFGVMLSQTYSSLGYAAITIYMAWLTFFVYSCMSLDSDRCISYINYGFYVSAVFCVAFFFLAKFQLIPGYSSFYRNGNELRVNGSFKDANVMAAYLCIPFMISFTRLVSQDNSKLWDIIIALGTLLVIIMSASRGGWINLATGLLIFFSSSLFMRDKILNKAKVIKFFIVIIPVMVMIVIAVLGAMDLEGFLESRLAYQSYDNHRFDNQLNAIFVFSQNLLGIGPGAYNADTYGLGVHSLYIRTLVENGLVGIILLILLLFSLFTSYFVFLTKGGVCKKVNLQVILFFSILAGQLVESIVIDSIHWRHFFIILAICFYYIDFVIFPKKRMVF